MTSAGSFTERVRQELTRTPVAPSEVTAELAVLLRLAGTIHRVGTPSGSHTTLEVTSTSGAAVRRVFRLLPAVTAARPELWVREPGGVRTAATYGLVLSHEVEALTEALGLRDTAGRPVAGLPPGVPPAVAARGSLMTVASLSDPGREVHVEFRAPSRAAGRDLRAAFGVLGVTARMAAGRDRLVLKSGEAVSRLLEAAGAVAAADEFDERRRRRQLRNDATRLANADAANLQRTIEAAQGQLDVIERAVARVGWSGLGEDLRSLALTRMVNPGASLAELGELCEPPIGKSAVHRRMRRFAELAGEPGGPDRPPSGD